MDVIGEVGQFHGYIIGLQIERTPDTENTGRKLYALFEYNGEVILKQVPDHDLFFQLARHLTQMAESRHACDDYGYNKLWIEKSSGHWKVELP